MLQAIPKEYREPIAIMVDQAFKTMNLSEDKKELVQQAMETEIMKARLASITEIAKMVTEGKGAQVQGMQADMARMQIQAQLQQMMMGMGTPQPQQPQTPQMISRPRRTMASPGNMQAMGQGPNLTQQIKNLPTPINP